MFLTTQNQEIEPEFFFREAEGLILYKVSKYHVIRSIWAHENDEGVLSFKKRYNSALQIKSASRFVILLYNNELFALDMETRMWTKFVSTPRLNVHYTLSRLSRRHLLLVGLDPGKSEREATIFDVEKREWKTGLEITEEMAECFYLLNLPIHRAVEIKTEKGVAVVCIRETRDEGRAPKMIVFDVSF